MTLILEYHSAARHAALAKLKRQLALRALVSDGVPQRTIAELLGVSQPSVSQQLNAGKAADVPRPDLLVEAGASIIQKFAESHGYRGVGITRRIEHVAPQAGPVIDLLVDERDHTCDLDITQFQRKIEYILGCPITLVDYGERPEDSVQECVQ